MKILIQITFLFFAIGNIFSQTLNPARAVNWSIVGVNEEFIPSTNFIDFQLEGGIADGITTNDFVFSTILNNLGDTSAFIFFPNGIYLFTQPLVLSDNISICGESSDSTILLFELSSANDLIIVAGSLLNDTSAVLSDMIKDSIKIEVNDASYFQTGDYVKIIEDDSQLITSSWALNTSGQINRIDSIENNIIYFSSPLRRNYQTNNNARIQKINMINNVGIENLKIERLDVTSQQTSNIQLNYASNCRIKCIESFKCNFAHIEVSNSTNIEIIGSYFHHAFSYGGDGKAYGVLLQYTTGECLVFNNIFKHLRHSMILQAGANGNVFAYNYSINPYWSELWLPSNSAGDLVLHGNYPYANLLEGNIIQNIVIDDSHGINGEYNTFFRNRAELYGIFMNFNPPSDNLNFIGNEITNNGLLYGNLTIFGSNHFLYGNNQTGSISPAGTNNLPEFSLFLDSMPEYFLTNSAWPPIGTPNQINSHSIEAKDRYFNGEFTSCAENNIILNQTDINKKNRINIFPNPSTGKFTVSGKNIQTIEIINISGQSVYFNKPQEMNNISRLFHIDLSNKSKGVYYIKIQINNRIEIRKLILI